MTHSSLNHTSLNILFVKDQTGLRLYALDEARYRLGRSSHSDIKVCCDRVSRSHATLFCIADAAGQMSYRLVDGDIREGKASKNGTFVNGIRISSHLLQNHDRINLGSKVVVRFFHFDQNACSQSDLLLAQKIQNVLSTQVKPQLQKTPTLARSIHFETVVMERPSSIGLPPNPKHGEEIAPTLQSIAVEPRSDRQANIDRQANRSQDSEPTLPRQKPELGELLLTHKLITLGQLKYALFRQRFKPSKLGEILIEEGMISSDVLEQVLKVQ